MTAALLDFPPPQRPKPRTQGPVTVGCLVSWTDPEAGSEWPELLVEFVYGRDRRALVRGWFGRMARSGDSHIESRVVEIGDLVVTGRAPVRAVL